MAKINHIQIGDKIRYIENISYQNSLPTATSDSADFVSVNNTLYTKQSFNGEYMYSQVGSGGGAEIVDVTIIESVETNDGTISFAELNQATYLKINSDSFVIIRLLPPAEEETQIAYFLTPVAGNPSTTSEDGSPMKIYGCSFEGMMNIMLMPLSQENDDGTISYIAYIIAEEITEVVANSSDSTTATLTKLKVDGVNYAVPSITEDEVNNLITSNETVITLTDEVRDLQTDKQDALVSGTNIKTINNETILGSGDIEVGGITIVDTLPEANAENFVKGKIYTQGELLKYITKIIAEEPTLSEVASLVSATTRFAAAAVGTNIYLFGGSSNSGSGFLNTINKFDTTTNTITTLSTTIPTAASSIAAAAAGTSIYLFGGYNNGTLSTINKFDTTTETISTLSATLPKAAETITVASVGSSIYLFGGYSSGNLDTINKFDTTTNTITTLSTTIPTATYGIGAAVVGTNIYLFGGYTDSGRLDTINKFDTTNETIETLSTALPTGTFRIGTTAVRTDIYLFGGSDSSGSYLNTINKFDTTTETITSLSATLPTAANSIAVTSVGSNIYLFGGYNGSILSTINKAEFDEYYSFETILDSETGVTEEEVNNILTSNETVITLTSDVRDLQTDKQDTLVSGTNIKTVNGESILGEGNLEISGGGSGEAKTIVEVNLTGATFDNTTYSVNIPNQSIELTDEQIETIQTNENVVIKATIGIESQSASLFIYLKPFPSAEGYGENETCINVWYGFSQIQAGTIKGYNVGLKCILSYSGSLVFESIGLINEGGGTETIIEVNLTGATLNETTGNLVVPNQSVALTDEQAEMIIANKNVVIKANMAVQGYTTVSLYLKPFTVQVAGAVYAAVWYGFMQQSQDGTKVFNIGLKCIAGSSDGETPVLVFENVGLINEGGTEVVANNGEETTDTLNTLKVGETNYAIPSGGDSPITIVNTLPEANEENYLKGKIYTEGDLLKYIAKIALTEPNLSQVASLVNAASGIAAAAVGTNIYLFGVNKLNTIYKFDTTTNTLTTLSATLPTGASGIAAASVGSNIYLFGGYTDSGRLDTINKFDTTNETITTLSTTIPTAAYNIAAAAIGSNVYLFGGYYNLNTINKFDTTNETITTLSTTLSAKTTYIAAAAVETDIYLFGGSTESGIVLNTINKFDTTTETLTTLSATLLDAAYSIGAAAVGTNIYLFGGSGLSIKNTITKAEFGYSYQYKTLPNLDTITNVIETEY